MDKALDWLRKEGENDEKPFFCYLAITIPHAAMEAPEKDVAPWRKKFPQFEKRKCSYGKSHTTNPAAQFAAMMTILDNEIGQVEALIAELGIDDSTIIMLSSDNGSHKEGGHMPEFFNSNGSLRGHKRDLYEGGVRTPFLVCWPGHVKAGSVSHLLSAHWDTFPTFCEIAGITPPTNLDGISYLPTLLGKTGQKKHSYLYWEFIAQGGKRALRFGKDGEWKAVQLKMSRNPNAAIELYNLKSDPREQHNVAKLHPELIQTVKKAFQKEHIANPRFLFRFEIPKQ
jgi:arylsulfatase A-like enzyme